MPLKQDEDATAGTKLLRLFRRLLLDGQKHYQIDLALWLSCSPQTIIRLMGEIEKEIGANLKTGLDKRKRWYQICPVTRNRLGLEDDALRYLGVCRDLAAPCLSEQRQKKFDNTLFDFSLLMANSQRSKTESQQNTQSLQTPQFTFFRNGKIDYTPHYSHLELLLEAMAERKFCVVRYRSPGKKESRAHRFAPYQLVNINNALYAAGATVTSDFRKIGHLTSFAVHRIQDVAILDKKISFQFPDADWAAFGLPWQPPHAYCIRFQPGAVSEYVQERIWGEHQTLRTLDDGSALLEITTGAELELLAWVRSFGGNAELIQK